MKSRPMIFSAQMVRALLAGQKTQTRRVFKAANEMETIYPPHLYDDLWRIYDADGDGINDLQCPYGVVGDRLWVRETYFPATDNSGNAVFVYKADQCAEWLQEWAAMDMGGWKSSMFMPRAASRIELEITSIRVERLQDISEADARAEGITDGGCLSCGNPEPCGCNNAQPDARDAYIWLWDSINGKKHPWSNNPWVWVVEFKVIKS